MTTNNPNNIPEEESKFFNLSLHLLLISGLDGIIKRVNPGWTEKLGYEIEELEGKPFMLLVHPDDQAETTAEMENLSKGVKTLKFENRYRHKNGEYRTLSWSAIPDPQKNIVYAIANDVTEYKKAMIKLQESEKRLLYSQEIGHLGFWDLNVITGELYWSDETFRIFGFKPQEFVPTYEKFNSIVHPDDIEFAQKHVDAALQDAAKYDIAFKIVRPNGEVRIINVQGDVTRDTKGKAIRFAGIQTDITERKKKEERLRLHSEIMTSMFEGVYLIRLDDGIIVYTNPRFEEMFGYDPGEMIGKYVTIVNAPTDKTPEETKQDIVGILVEAGEWHGEVENIKKDGTHFWCYANVSLFDHPEYGRVMISVHTDITERRKAEQKLIASEKRYKYLADELELIIDHLPGIVVYKDTENNLLRVNKFLADAHNLNKDEMEGVSSFDIYPREQAQAYWDDDLEVVKSKQPKINIIEPWESDLGKKWLNTSKIPYIDENGDVKGIIALAFDITERMKIEEALKESEEKYREAYERAEIYKDLFAHDISNILQNIKSSIGLMSIWQDKPEQEKINEVIQIVENQIIRGAKLISNIRRLSQITEKSGELENINPLDKINEAIRFLQKSYPEKQIVINIESQINDTYIKANDLLLDVYENIMINAVKYNENPIIEILIRISKLKEKDIDYIKFEFVDNGIGISNSMKEGIFKGTTKRENRSKGLGLGLIVVRRIIKSFNGKFWVEDNVKGDPSKGSNFIVQLLEVK